MTIRYSLTRFEIVRTYLFALLRSNRMLAIALVISAWPGLLRLVCADIFTHDLSIRDCYAALTWLAGTFCLLLLWVFLRAKTDERILSISEQGIHTEIGRIKADYPWAKIKEVRDIGHYILVINKSGNAFFVPLRAFENSAHRGQFVAELNDYRAAK